MGAFLKVQGRHDSQVNGTTKVQQVTLSHVHNLCKGCQSSGKIRKIYSIGENNDTQNKLNEYYVKRYTGVSNKSMKATPPPTISHGHISCLHSGFFFLFILRFGLVFVTSFLIIRGLFTKKFLGVWEKKRGGFRRHRVRREARDGNHSRCSTLVLNTWSMMKKNHYQHQ